MKSENLTDFDKAYLDGVSRLKFLESKSSEVSYIDDLVRWFFVACGAVGAAYFAVNALI